MKLAFAGATSSGTAAEDGAVAEVAVLGALYSSKYDEAAASAILAERPPESDIVPWSAADGTMFSELFKQHGNNLRLIQRGLFRKSMSGEFALSQLNETNCIFGFLTFLVSFC